MKKKQEEMNINRNDKLDGPTEYQWLYGIWRWKKGRINKGLKKSLITPIYNKDDKNNVTITEGLDCLTTVWTFMPES
jgi:hypothetical protein